MKKIVLLIFTLGISLSCTSTSHMSLRNDTYVLQVFNKDEISSLELIVNFFDSFIVKNTEKGKDISHSYYQYLEALKNSESLTDMKNRIGLANSDISKTLITELKNKGIFNEIWKYSYGQDLGTTDTLSMRLELNMQGKYVKLVELLGENNIFFSEYAKELQINGCISPGNIALFMKYFRKVNFQKEVYRLVFAVHYITIISEGKYKK